MDTYTPKRATNTPKMDWKNTCFLGKKVAEVGTTLPPLRFFFLLPKTSSGFGWYPTAFEEKNCKIVFEGLLEGSLTKTMIICVWEMTYFPTFVELSVLKLFHTSLSSLTFSFVRKCANAYCPHCWAWISIGVTAMVKYLRNEDRTPLTFLTIWKYEAAILSS